MEVPLRNARVPEFVGNPAIQRVGVGADDPLLGGHREIHAVIGFAKRLDRRLVVRLLAAEVVRRHAEHDQSALAVAFPERLQFLVLRRETAERRRVHEQQRPAGVVGERQRRSVDPAEIELVRRTGVPGHRQAPRDGDPRRRGECVAHRLIPLPFATVQPRSRKRRALSLCQLRSLVRSRLSCWRRPRASPSSTFARPARLKYSLSGTTV